MPQLNSHTNGGGTNKNRQTKWTNTVRTVLRISISAYRRALFILLLFLSIILMATFRPDDLWVPSLTTEKPPLYFVLCSQKPQHSTHFCVHTCQLFSQRRSCAQTAPVVTLRLQAGKTNSKSRQFQELQQSQQSRKFACRWRENTLTVDCVFFSNREFTPPVIVDTFRSNKERTPKSQRCKTSNKHWWTTHTF